MSGRSTVPNLFEEPSKPRSPSVSSQSSLTIYPKTSVIINNLQRNDFIVDEKSTTYYEKNSRTLPLVDQIKLSILNLEDEDHEENDYCINHIEYWSNLPFLNRTIILLKDEVSALKVYSHLSSTLADKFPYIKVSLQENLLSKSKSFDSLINPTHDKNLNSIEELRKFRSFHNSPQDQMNDYEEPKPYDFKVVQDLSKLGIDVSQYNNEEQFKELSDSESPTPSRAPLERHRSLTKTLFRPTPIKTSNLNNDNNDDDDNENKNEATADKISRGGAMSPTITLDAPPPS
ncbi:hypothetical protein DFJ63DRAFT_68355 [Scheffersomyces coipomensis]|uniref:uncharacterized protein n=1 Tax=Scheffersomyces coipomensis TaxID=1788519 RepID=UPI00315CF2AE